MSPERLAGRALHQDLFTTAEEAHLHACVDCRHELAELERVTALASEAETTAVPLAPDPVVWQRIAAAVADSAAIPAAAVPLTGVPVPGSVDVVPRHSASGAASDPPRVRRRTAVVAAALALVVGVAGTLIATGVGRTPSIPTVQPAQVVARVALTAVPGRSGSGEALLLRTAADVELRVVLQAPEDDRAFHELWLINADGERMYALGVLPASGVGSYPLPPELSEDLDGYRTVDVSVEPYDGDAAHSRDSLVRGLIPV